MNAPAPTSASAPSKTEKQDQPTISVAICTHKRAGYLRSCLESIARLQQCPSELIVIDNTDGDAETQAVSQEHAARYVIEPHIGLSRARNRAILESSSEIIAFLDDDAVPNSRWLNFLREPFTDQNVAAVTGSTKESSESIESTEAPRMIDKSNPDWFVIAGFGGLGIGANMALRKSLCSDPAIFDERLGRGGVLAGGEESHAFLKLLARGYRVFHQPSAVVDHPNKPINIEVEAPRAIAYWLLLFCEFPRQRLDLLRFLLNRLRHKPLTWHRTSPDFGPIITSGWGLRTRAFLAGLRLYLAARRQS